MRRLLWLCPPLLAVEVYRRGYLAAVLFGVRQHCRARPDRYYQPDIIA